MIPSRANIRKCKGFNYLHQELSLPGEDYPGFMANHLHQTNKQRSITEQTINQCCIWEAQSEGILLMSVGKGPVDGQ
jgi:hypothetical protein